MVIRPSYARRRAHGNRVADNIDRAVIHYLNPLAYLHTFKLPQWPQPCPCPHPIPSHGCGLPPILASHNEHRVPLSHHLNHLHPWLSPSQRVRPPRSRHDFQHREALEQEVVGLHHLARQGLPALAPRSLDQRKTYPLKWMNRHILITPRPKY